MNFYMKNIYPNIIRTFTTLLFLFLANPWVYSTDFYVAPNGRNSNAGTEQAPFATIEKALDAVKAEFRKAPDQDCTIWIADGTYRIFEPLTLRSDDFQNNKANLIISALPGTKPVISGGWKIKGWQRTSGGLWKAIISEDTPNHLNPRELFVHDRRAIRARHPNEGYLRVTKVGADRRTNFFFEEGDFPLPASPEQTELILLHDWSISRIPVKEINTGHPEGHKLTTVDSIGARQPAFFNLDNWEPHPRYFLENDKQFLDADYEWYYDKNENVLYIQLPSDQNPNDSDIIIPISKGLVNLSGSMERPLKNIRFIGLTFEHSAWNIPERGYAGVQACHFDPRLPTGTDLLGERQQASEESGPNKKGWAVVPSAIQGNWVENTSFASCIFRHLGGSGLWLGTRSRKNTIINCEFSDISGNGIMIGEGRDRTVNVQPWWQEAPDQVALGNTVEGNTIKGCGIQYFGAVGIWCGLTAETTIRNNEIYNLPYTGISIGWMWSPVSTPCRENILDGNHIHHIMQQLSDGGGIYMLGLQPGSKILHNRIHDVHINAGRAESNGMFLDEGTTDVLVANNLIYGIAKSPLRFHKATTNIVRDNLLFCKEKEPPIRYNATEEKNIIKEDNRVFTEGEKGYEKELQKAVKKWKNQKR